jgi:hypothetical protein
MLILDALESRLNGALEYPIFSFLYISEHVLNLDENSSAPFGILEVLMILISAFITQLMGVIHHACKITIMHKVPPR